MGEVCLEKEVRSLPARTGEGAVRSAEGGDVLGLRAVENPHESASLTRSWSPLHMAAPRSTTASTALTPVAEFNGDEVRDIAGGGASFLELVEAFNAFAEVPHPLSKPQVMGISVVCRSCRAAPVEGTRHRDVELGDESVELLSGH